MAEAIVGAAVSRTVTCTASAALARPTLTVKVAVDTPTGRLTVEVAASRVPKMPAQR